MALFSKKTSGKERVIIFDIGSGSVGGAVVVLSKTGKPEVIKEARAPISFQENLDPARFVGAALSALGIVSEAVLNKSGGARRIMCVYSSPWYLSQTKFLTFSKKEPFVVTKKIISELIENEKVSFDKSDLSRQVGRDGGEAELIERKIIDIKLNGYSVPNPIGKKASEIKAAVFMGAIPKAVISSVEGVLSRTFHINDISHHSFALAAFTVLRDIYNAVESFLFLDISGEVTEISIVKNGALLETETFPKGRNFLLRSAAKALKTIPDEALSSLRLYLEGEKLSDSAERINKVLSRAKDVWINELGEALGRFAEGGALPKTLFFSADKDIGKIFSEFLRDPELSYVTPTEGAFDVIFLDGNKLRPFCIFEDGVVKDPFIALEAVFASKLYSLK